MSLCIKTNQEHRWEYFGVQQGEEWERCLDCSEVRLARYHDTGSGG
jgi:hypothetical protein